MKTVETTYTFSHAHIRPKQKSESKINHAYNQYFTNKDLLQTWTRTPCGKWVGKCDGKSHEKVWIHSVSPFSHKSISLPLKADQRLGGPRVLHRIPLPHRDLHILHLSSAESQQIQDGVFMVCQDYVALEGFVEQVIFQWMLSEMSTSEHCVSWYNPCGFYEIQTSLCNHRTLS